MKAGRFAARLKELREVAGLTQKQLADKAGIGQRTVSHLEQGTREPVWSTAIALADALGVDCRAFLEQPAGQPEPKRGRPAKQQDTAPPASKRRRKPRQT